MSVDRHAAPNGVRVEVRDGAVTYRDAHRFTIADNGDLLILDAAEQEVARFGVGNWLNAELLTIS